MRRRGAAPGVEILDGARPGPRAYLSAPARIGDVTEGAIEDLLGVAVARQLEARVAPLVRDLAGSIVLAPRGLDAHPPAEWTNTTFGVEVSSGPAGWITTPHLVADLRLPRSARLARAFGEPIVVNGVNAGDQLGGDGRLRFEAGELGRVDPAVVARAVDGFFALLVAMRMLPGEAPRPSVRMAVDEITRLRSRAGGALVPLAAPGTAVTAGSPLLAVCDREGEPRAFLSSARRSVILALPAAAVATPGGVVARLGHVVTLTRPRVAASAHLTVGWCEWIALPDLGVARLHAKVDTGAKTCALHVLSLRRAGEDAGRPVLDLRLVAGRPAVRVVVEEEVVVRDSGGHAEKRPVIETTLVLGAIRRRVRVTLTHRGDMQFPMLIGRNALGGDIRVDPGARHAVGPPHRSR